MVHRLPHLRTLLHPALSLLVLASNVECQVKAAETIAIMARPAINPDGTRHRPLSLPPWSCENESGCMCRGATLAVSVDAAQLAPQLSDLSAILVHDAALVTERLFPSANEAEFFRSPPLSGRMLRAHLASFLN